MAKSHKTCMEQAEVMVVVSAPSWAQPIRDFLVDGILPEDEAEFLFSAVFVFQVFRPLKVLQNFRKNYIKNQRPGSFRNHQGRRGGAPQGLHKGPGAAPP